MKLKNIVWCAVLGGLAAVQSAGWAKDVVVGVSWSNFQEERWKRDESAIKAALSLMPGMPRTRMTNTKGRFA